MSAMTDTTGMVSLRPGRTVSRLMHAVLISTAFLVFAWPLVLPSGLAMGALGAGLGVFMADRVVSARYRFLAVLILCLGLGIFGDLLADALVSMQWLAELLSPPTTLYTAEGVRWFFIAHAASLLIRAAGLRYDSALAIEGGLIILALARTVEAHRDGMIARPLEISDWFWRQGIDPVQAFLGLGVIGALLLCGILVYGRRLSYRRTSRSGNGRSIVQLMLVLILGLFLAAKIHSQDSQTKHKNAIGGELKKKKDDKRTGQGGGGAGQKPKPPDDGMPPPGGKSQNRPSAVVIFHKNVVPTGGVFYFRHGTFSQFNGVRLIESTRPEVDRDARHTFPSGKETVPGRHNDGHGRTMVATDVALLTKHTRLFALVDPVELSSMPNPEPARFRRAYRVVSNVVTASTDSMLGATPGDPKWKDEIWEHYTELPKDDRYHRLAAELRQGLRAEFAADPLAQAYTVKRYLEQNATYSFARNYEGSEDPTAEFLFSKDKKGYCVHLAHSMAYLLRAMGVPTRVSAGYAVPAQNLGGGSALLIKAGDAHAWAEIFLQDVGWVPVEVTPEKTDIKPKEFTEKDLQQLLGEMARKEGRFERSGYQGPKLGDLLKRIWAMVPWALLIAVVIAYLIKFWRLLAPAMAGASKQPRVAYRAALDRLSAAGLIRERGEPRERFAKRVLPQAPSFEALTQAHVAAALGSAKAAERQLKPMAAQVGAELRARVPKWRWLLGTINPVSWWWSR